MSRAMAVFSVAQACGWDNSMRSRLSWPVRQARPDWAIVTVAETLASSCDSAIAPTTLPARNRPRAHRPVCRIHDLSAVRTVSRIPWAPNAWLRLEPSPRSVPQPEQLIGLAPTAPAVTGT